LLIASCVDRIAIRECESDCGEKVPGHGSGVRVTACAVHKKRTREKYAAKLAALDCICRALVALGQESCCITKEQSPTRKRRGMRKSSDILCASLGIRNERPSKSHYAGVSRHRNTESKVKSPACTRGCCEPANVSHSKYKGRATGRAREIDSGGDESIDVIHAQGGSADIEKGTFGIEHVVLSITGMTCTGCESKLQKVLGTLPPITYLKTSLVMARAEFSLDTASMSPESVMKHLKRTTEFKCERISTQGSNIDVVPSNVNDFLDQPLPLGVNDIQLVGKGVVRINFDPKAIGARNLIKKNGKYSCQLAPPPTDPGLAAGSKHVRNMGHMTLLSIVLTVPVLVLAWAPIKDRPVTYGAVSLAFATIIQFVVAGPFYPKALKSLIFSRMVEMDLLIVLSTSAAYIFSVVSFGYLVGGKPLSTGEFFETSTLLVALIMIGRWIAALSRQKAVESISIRSLQSSKAQLVTQEGTEIEEIDTRLLEYGDMFNILPEHRVPTDGIVISGYSEINESMLTGESRPIEKHVGSKVIAGSINGSGKLIVRLTHLPGENTISVIAGMVDNAKLSKPKIQDLADRVASYFVPVIVSLTIITFVVWIGVGVAVQKKSGSDAAIQAITYAITVLIVSCPCAIGLAVPMVIVIGSGVAAERGIIFKSAESIEIAFKATHVVFDKTGTLTTGKLKVVEEQFITEDSVTQRSMVLGLVANSKHPVSTAVAAHFTTQGISAAKMGEIKTVAGNGIEGKVNGKIIRGGNARWLEVDSDARVQSVMIQGHTLFCVTLNSELFAVFGLSDTVRPEAADIIAKLRRSGVHVSLLSGDDVGAVQHIATQIGLNPDEARSRCSPGDKQTYIQELSVSFIGKRKAAVIFVGDGTNDAVALAQATIGVHMNSGTDVAQCAADVVLMRPSLEGVLTMIDISHAAVLRIKFNFGWSLVYNVLALLFASGALVSAHKGTAIKIPPQYAGLGELVSVLPVIAIAVGLKWSKF
jgi:Cd2+-exporting ATPase